MAAKVLSIEIGSSLTKVVEMDYQNKMGAAKIYHCFSFETPQGIVSDGVVKVSERFRRTLKERLHERKIHTTKVVFSINSGRIANREVTIPMVKENKIQPLLMANSSEYFPVDLTQYQLVYRILDKSEGEGNKKLKLSVYAVPVEIIVAYQRLAEFLGMTIKSIDYVGNSIYQEMKKMSGKEQSVILKIDEDSSMITIVKEGQVKLQRSMPYGISKEENGDDMRYLIGNVSRVIDYYGSQNSDSPITGLWLAGMGAEEKGIAEMLSEELNIRTGVLQKLPDISVAKEVAEDFNPAGYIACVGAVVAPLPFRFLEDEAGKKKMALGGDSFKIPIIAASVCAAFSLGLVLYGTIHYMNLDKESRTLADRIEALQPAKQIYNKYNEVSAEHQDVEQMQAMTKTPNDALLELLAEMEGNMPSNMRLTGMSANQQGVTMSVTTADKESAAKVIMELREFTTLDSVTTTEITEEQDETGVKKVAFTVNCTYRSISDGSGEESSDTENDMAGSGTEESDTTENDTAEGSTE